MKLCFSLLILFYSSLGFSQQKIDTLKKYGSLSVVRYSYANPSEKISWLHVHKEEATSLNVAKEIFNSLGWGQIITLLHPGTRNIEIQFRGRKYSYDPNRIFSLVGVKNTLDMLNSNYRTQAYLEDSILRIGNALLKEAVVGKSVVVALHNNKNLGALHINSYDKGGQYEKETKKVSYAIPTSDYDNFFFTTNEVMFNYLKKANQNVVLQDNELVTDDGSMSVYCGKNNIPYLNIEVQHNSKLSQKGMINLSLKMLKELGYY